ncbi:MAG: hypothetical protein A4E73_03261 [Syntrophaceae bacterium PtaU1.Bin231]|nr:MAG: hypothetical protein A4E73_03261 [Syntrophaceae bacterium PtaU1.Bin231]
MNRRFEPYAARVVDRDDVFDLLAHRGRVLCQDFIDGLDGKSLSPGAEHPETVGAGDDDVADAISDQEIPHLPEHRAAVIFVPEVMGYLHAAVQNDAQNRDRLLQVLIELKGLLRTRSRQGAAREKHGIAFRRHCIIGEEPGGPPLFIGQQAAVFGVVRGVAPHLFAAHFQEQIGRVDFLRADGGAQPAQTALKRHGLKGSIGRIVGSGDLSGCAVTLQESASLSAGAAVAAILRDLTKEVLHPHLRRSV